MTLDAVSNRVQVDWQGPLVKASELENLNDLFYLLSDNDKDVNYESVFANIQKNSSVFEDLLSSLNLGDTAYIEAIKDMINQFNQLGQKPLSEQMADFYENRLDGIYEELKKKRYKEGNYKRITSKDIGEYLRSTGEEDLVNYMESDGKSESVKLWTKFKFKKELEYNTQEDTNFEKFLKQEPVDSPLWDDLPALVAKFQKEFPQHSGDYRVSHFLTEFETYRDSKEWKEAYRTLEDQRFYPFLDEAIQKDPTLLDNPSKLIALFAKQYPQYNRKDNIDWYLKVGLENWKANNQKEIFRQENEALQNFFTSITPQQLDNPQQALADYQRATRFGTEKNGEYFLAQLETHKENLKSEQNQEYQQAANRLSDPVIANAMMTAFRETQSFVERDKYLGNGPEGAETKVAEYQQALDQIGRVLPDLQAKAAVSPSLQAKLTGFKNTFDQGKRRYDQSFVSPRTYLEDLQQLHKQSDELISRDAVGGISRAASKPLPAKLPDKDLNYEEFRDVLKKENFYELDKLQTTVPGVRNLIRAQTEKLHSQWQLDREAKASENFKLAEAKINRVKLSDLQDLPLGKTTYQEVDKLVRQQKLYDLDPKDWENPAIRNLAGKRNEQLMLEHNQAYELSVIKAKSAIKSQTFDRVKGLVDFEVMPPEKISYEAFRDQLKANKLYGDLSADQLKDAEIRDTIASQNKSLYQRFLDWRKGEQTKETREGEKTLTTKLDQFELDAQKGNLTFLNYQSFEAAFLRANPDQKSLIGSNPVLAQFLRDQFATRFGAGAGKLAEAANDNQPGLENLAPELQEMAAKVPSNARIDWRAFSRLGERQQTQALERFNRMMNDNSTGLQSFLARFPGSFGNFALQTLGVMRQDQFDKTMASLRVNPVSPNSSEGVSQWLRIFSDNIEMTEIARFIPNVWAEFQRNYQAVFRTSYLRDWEEKIAMGQDFEAENDFEMSGELEPTALDTQSTVEEVLDPSEDIVEIEEGTDKVVNLFDSDLQLVEVDQVIKEPPEVEPVLSESEDLELDDKAEAVDEALDLAVDFDLDDEAENHEVENLDPETDEDVSEVLDSETENSDEGAEEVVMDEATDDEVVTFEDWADSEMIVVSPEPTVLDLEINLPVELDKLADVARLEGLSLAQKAAWEQFCQKLNNLDSLALEDLESILALLGDHPVLRAHLQRIRALFREKKQGLMPFDQAFIQTNFSQNWVTLQHFCAQMRTFSELNWDASVQVLPLDSPQTEITGVQAQAIWSSFLGLTNDQKNLEELVIGFTDARTFVCRIDGKRYQLGF